MLSINGAHVAHKMRKGTPGRRIQTSLGLLELDSYRARLYDEAWRGAELDIDPVLYRVLSVIDRIGPVRLAVAASEARLSLPVMSTQTARLERIGLVERTTDRFDHRMTVVQLSSSGRLTVGRLNEELAKRLDLWFSHWPDGELELLADLLERFVEDLRHGR
jgi:DNA-binding MarR family transcriptional regulator